MIPKGFVSKVPQALERPINIPGKASFRGLRCILIHRLDVKIAKTEFTFFKDLRPASVAVHCLHIDFRNHRYSFYLTDALHDGKGIRTKFFKYLK